MGLSRPPTLSSGWKAEGSERPRIPWGGPGISLGGQETDYLQIWEAGSWAPGLHCLLGLPPRLSSTAVPCQWLALVRKAEIHCCLPSLRILGLPVGTRVPSHAAQSHAESKLRPIFCILGDPTISRGSWDIGQDREGLERQSQDWRWLPMGNTIGTVKWVRQRKLCPKYW